MTAETQTFQVANGRMTATSAETMLSSKTVPDMSHSSREGPFTDW